MPSKRLLAPSLWIVFTVAALISTSASTPSWRNEWSYRFLDSLPANIRRAGHPVTVADLSLPSTTLPEPLGLAVSTATFLPAPRPQPPILRESDAVERLAPWTTRAM